MNIFASFPTCYFCAEHTYFLNLTKKSTKILLDLVVMFLISGCDFLQLRSSKIVFKLSLKSMNDARYPSHWYLALIYLKFLDALSSNWTVFNPFSTMFVDWFSTAHFFKLLGFRGCYYQTLDFTSVHVFYSAFYKLMTESVCWVFFHQSSQFSAASRSLAKKSSADSPLFCVVAMKSVLRGCR